MLVEHTETIITEDLRLFQYVKFSCSIDNHVGRARRYYKYRRCVFLSVRRVLQLSGQPCWFEHAETTITEDLCFFQYVEFSGSVDNHVGSSTQKLKCESEFVTSLERGQIAAGQTEVWDDVSLEVPAVPPSRLVGCNIINISYVVKVGGWASRYENTASRPVGDVRLSPLMICSIIS